MRGGVPDIGGVEPKCEVGALNIVDERFRREGRSSASACLRVSAPKEEIDDAMDILAGVVIPRPIRWLEEVFGVPSKLVWRDAASGADTSDVVDAFGDDM